MLDRVEAPVVARELPEVVPVMVVPLDPEPPVDIVDPLVPVDWSVLIVVPIPAPPVPVVVLVPMEPEPMPVPVPVPVVPVVEPVVDPEPVVVVPVPVVEPVPVEPEPVDWAIAPVASSAAAMPNISFISSILPAI